MSTSLQKDANKASERTCDIDDVYFAYADEVSVFRLPILGIAFFKKGPFSPNHDHDRGNRGAGEIPPSTHNF